MTTSKIDSIGALIIEHLQEVSGLTACMGPVSDAQNHPFAMVRIDPAGETTHMYPQGYSDRYFTVGILLEGTKAEISYAIEQIWTLWNDATRRSELGAYGMWQMVPLDAEEPFTYENEMAIGSVEFDLRVRYAP